MCLAVPGVIREIHGTMAEVDMGGPRRTVSLQLVPEARIGDYVQVHAGYAIALLDEVEAEATLGLLRALGVAAGSPWEERAGREIR